MCKNNIRFFANWRFGIMNKIFCCCSRMRQNRCIIVFWYSGPSNVFDVFSNVFASFPLLSWFTLFFNLINIFMSKFSRSFFESACYQFLCNILWSWCLRGRMQWFQYYRIWRFYTINNILLVFKFITHFTASWLTFSF